MNQPTWKTLPLMLFQLDLITTIFSKPGVWSVSRNVILFWLKVYSFRSMCMFSKANGASMISFTNINRVAILTGRGHCRLYQFYVKGVLDLDLHCISFKIFWNFNAILILLDLKKNQIFQMNKFIKALKIILISV